MVEQTPQQGAIAYLFRQGFDQCRVTLTGQQRLIVIAMMAPVLCHFHEEDGYTSVF